jgi:hypothetical protein
MAEERIYVVFGGGIVIRAYHGPNGLTLAGIHSRCITGATVVPCDLSDSLPDDVRNDLSEEWGGDDDTPLEALDDHEPEPES